MDPSPAYDYPYLPDARTVEEWGGLVEIKGVYIPIELERCWVVGKVIEKKKTDE